jgi:hypothetical protein
VTDKTKELASMTIKLTGTAKIIMWVGIALLAVSALLIVLLPPVLGGIAGGTGTGQTLGSLFSLLVQLVREIAAPLGAAFVGAALVIGSRADRS